MKNDETELVIREYTINHNLDLILQSLYQEKAAVVAFSCYIWNIHEILTIAKELHKVAPDTRIWLGGPEVSFDSERLLQENVCIEGIIQGEGEVTFYEMTKVWSQKADVDRVAGIMYRDETGMIHQNPPRAIMSLDDVPFIYKDLTRFRNKILYYETSRGCPFSCSYCLSSVDKTLRFRDIELVKKELKYFIDQKVPQIKFVDRTFNCNHKHAMEIWKFIKENDNGVTNFHFEISADLINDEELELISDMRPGLIQLEIGVQSTNEVTIKEIHRTMKLDLLKDIVTKIQAGGNIHEHLDLIAGLPYEGYESFRKSFDEIYELKPNQLQLGFLKILKGSYMYEHAVEYGIVYHDKPPYEVLKTNWLSFDEVLKIKQVEEMLEVYYNSGQFEVTMKIFEKMFDSAFDMFRQMGEFYEQNGYFGMNHSRIKRCEILLDFVKQYEFKEEHVHIIEEALIFDLYYRENCKSRPSWAADMSKFKHMTHHYCRKGKVSHVEPFHYNFPDKKTKTIEVLPKREVEPLWILFHYDKRDPLDHQAFTEKVEYVAPPEKK